MKNISEEYIVNKNGKKTSVILPLKRYEDLLEDIHDLSVIAERRDEGTIDLSEMKKRLKKSGAI